MAKGIAVATAEAETFTAGGITIQTASARKPYPLNQSEIEVTITARHLTLGHKLSKPTLDQLIARDSATVIETEEVGANEDSLNVDDHVANSRLWDALAVAVRGYRMSGDDAEKAQAWRDATDEIKAKIPTAHKAAALRGMFDSFCEVEQEEVDTFALDGGDTVTVRQEIGRGIEPEFIIRYAMQQPSETQRRDYVKRATRATTLRGQRKRKTRIQFNLRADVEMFDALCAGIEGATPADKSLVSPIHKRQVVQALMGALETSLSD